MTSFCICCFRVDVEWVLYCVSPDPRVQVDQCANSSGVESRVFGGSRRTEWKWEEQHPGRHLLRHVTINQSPSQDLQRSEEQPKRERSCFTGVRILTCFRNVWFRLELRVRELDEVLRSSEWSSIMNTIECITSMDASRLESSSR